MRLCVRACVRACVCVIYMCLDVESCINLTGDGGGGGGQFFQYLEHSGPVFVVVIRPSF